MMARKPSFTASVESSPSTHASGREPPYSTADDGASDALAFDSRLGHTSKVLAGSMGAVRCVSNWQQLMRVIERQASAWRLLEDGVRTWRFRMTRRWNLDSIGR